MLETNLFRLISNPNPNNLKSPIYKAKRQRKSSQEPHLHNRHSRSKLPNNLTNNQDQEQNSPRSRNLRCRNKLSKRNQNHLKHHKRKSQYNTRLRMNLRLENLRRAHVQLLQAISLYRLILRFLTLTQSSMAKQCLHSNLYRVLKQLSKG